MRTAKLGLVLLVISGNLAWLQAASRPIYDEKADAHKQVAAGIAQAERTGKNVVLVFGANWCVDCHALDEQMHKGELAKIIQHDYVVVKIDVGRFNKNLELGTKYGVPIKHGIPAVAILDSHGKLLYAQDQGQFANAHLMTYEPFLDFFRKWEPAAHHSHAAAN